MFNSYSSINYPLHLNIKRAFSGLNLPNSYQMITPFLSQNIIPNYPYNNYSYLLNNFSNVGYQIMNPQTISYHLEPIYSHSSLVIQRNPTRRSVEIGEPVDDCKYIITRKDNFPERKHFRSITDVCDKINRTKLEEKSFKENYDRFNYSSPKKNNYSESTKMSSRNNHERLLTEPYENEENEEENSFRQQYSGNNNKNRRKIKPFALLNNEFQRSFGKLRNSINSNINIHRRSLKEWNQLIKSFVNISSFWKSSSKYSSYCSQNRENSILIRTKQILREIGVLKDWIISIEEKFFNKFRDHDKFSIDLKYLNLKGNNKKINTKILKIIKLFVNNLNDKYIKIDDIPENIHKILYEFIKSGAYYPRKYLSKFQIYRLDFNFYGAIKNITCEQRAMILAYLIINGVTVQQILLHINEIFLEYKNSPDVQKCARNIGSILHYLIKRIFKSKVKVLNDVLALFNYYRNYHLLNEQIENFKRKLNDNKINFHFIVNENDNEDEYSSSLIPRKEIQNFFENNREELKEIEEIIFKWFMKLAKFLSKKAKMKDKEKCSSRVSSNKDIKSSIYSKKKSCQSSSEECQRDRD